MPPPGEMLDTEAVVRTDRWLGRLARGLVTSDFDADDVRQDTWLAVLRRPVASQEPSRSWLGRVASNFVRKGHRELSRRKRREHAASRPERDLTLPERDIERRELRRRVLGEVLALREPYRSTVVLRFLDGKSLKEVAAAQDVSVNTVKTRVRRALALLRRRLGGLAGERRSWPVLLAPSLPSFPAEGGGTTSAFLSDLVRTGVIAVKTKTLLPAACLSLVAVAAVGVALHRSRPASNGAPARIGEARVSADLGDPIESRAAASIDEGPAPGPDAVSAPGGVVTPAADQPEPPADDAASVETPASPTERASLAPASADTVATRRAFAELKRRFGEGGRTGWDNVRDHIGPLEELLLAADDGFVEFLALLDEEPDAWFLEAVMHHLPLARTELRDEILADEMLHEEIWARFEEEEDPRRRMAFLRFFAFNRKLSSSRMGEFLELARSEPAEVVRQLSVDAIASNRDLIGETWATLATVFENDPSSECRETAIHGLAFAGSEGAKALVTRAFASPDEQMRAAALASAAGEEPPPELTGGDTVGYLVRELRAASTPRYKKALVERLLERAPGVLEEEIGRALPDETDWAVRKVYKDALGRIAEGRAARPE